MQRISTIAVRFTCCKPIRPAVPYKKSGGSRTEKQRPWAQDLTNPLIFSVKKAYTIEPMLPAPATALGEAVRITAQHNPGQILTAVWTVWYIVTAGTTLTAAAAAAAFVTGTFNHAT